MENSLFCWVMFLPSIRKVTVYSSDANTYSSRLREERVAFDAFLKSFVNRWISLEMKVI